jgi:beta-galactosidase
VVREQLLQPASLPISVSAPGSPTLPVSDLQIKPEGNVINFSNGDIAGRFNTANGQWVQYTFKGEPLLKTFPEPYFWRAPTDNDFRNQIQERLGVWRSAHANRRFISAKVGEKTADGLKIEVKFRLTDVSAAYQVNYTILSNGAVKVEALMEMDEPQLPEMPRFGMRMQLGREYEQIEYYGRGPWENYTDRNTASFIGEYNQPSSDMFVANYIRPQENGYRTDIRWIKFISNKGGGLMITGVQPVGFSALPYTAEDMHPCIAKKNQHPSDLNERNFISLHIDLRQPALVAITAGEPCPMHLTC